MTSSVTCAILHLHAVHPCHFLHAADTGQSHILTPVPPCMHINMYMSLRGCPIALFDQTRIYLIDAMSTVQALHAHNSTLCSTRYPPKHKCSPTVPLPVRLITPCHTIETSFAKRGRYSSKETPRDIKRESLDKNALKLMIQPS